MNVKETSEMRRLRKQLERAITVVETTDDPIVRLHKLKTVAVLTDHIKLLLVIEARKAGFSWQVIANHLKVSRQAAWEKYHTYCGADFDGRDCICFED